ncbi:Uncharacterised protein [Serratia quinivorans]|nr:Uncharacterised protein [Serratia quinivorans]
MCDEHVEIYRPDCNIADRAGISVIQVNRCLNEVRIQQLSTYGIEFRITFAERSHIKDNDSHYLTLSLHGLFINLNASHRFFLRQSFQT